MSKAFTKEDDDYLETDEDELQNPAAIALQGKNYITPSGFEALKNRYKQLKYSERPGVVRTVTWAAENGDRSENADYTYGKKRLRQIDRELGFLGSRIRSAEVVDPALIKSSTVAFGATVTILNEEDWQSPLASALIGKKIGDQIEFRSPKGIQEIEIIKIQYE